MLVCEIKLCISLAKSKHSNSDHSTLFEDIGESLQRIVEASDDGNASPDLVPQSQRVDGPSYQHAAEDHPEGEARHVPRGVALVVGDVRPVLAGLTLPVCQADHFDCSGGHVLRLAPTVVRDLQTDGRNY